MVDNDVCRLLKSLPAAAADAHSAVVRALPGRRGHNGAEAEGKKGDKNRRPVNGRYIFGVGLRKLTAIQIFSA
jgi:hypothetical protein